MNAALMLYTLAIGCLLNKCNHYYFTTCLLSFKKLYFCFRNLLVFKNTYSIFLAFRDILTNVLETSEQQNTLNSRGDKIFFENLFKAIQQKVSYCYERNVKSYIVLKTEQNKKVQSFGVCV